jgi:hypothetical protein
MQPGDVQQGTHHLMALLFCLQAWRKVAIGEYTLCIHAQAALGADEELRKDLHSQICALSRLQQDSSTLLSCAVA